MSEQSDIISSFLLDAPPGEFKQCAAALACIAPSKKAVDAAVAATEREWNHRQFTPVAIGNHTAIVCDEAAASDGRYVDPATGQYFRYDPAKKAASAADGSVRGSALRAAVQQLLGAYAAEAYGENGAAGAYDARDDANRVIVIMRSSSVSLSNYRTGIVVGRYVIDGGARRVTGEIRTQQHFFENGNAMSKFAAQIDKEIEGEAPEELASAFIREVAAFESSFYNEYLLGLLKIGAEGLNHLRRKLPVTASKINWEMELTTGAAMQLK